MGLFSGRFFLCFLVVRLLALRASMEDILGSSLSEGGSRASGLPVGDSVETFASSDSSSASVRGGMGGTSVRDVGAGDLLLLVSGDLFLQGAFILEGRVADFPTSFDVRGRLLGGPESDLRRSVSLGGRAGEGSRGIILGADNVAAVGVA